MRILLSACRTPGGAPGRSSAALTVVTGVSGSGKSSLVFETIAKESQRQFTDDFPLFIRNRLPRFELVDG